MNNEIILFENQNIKLEVNMKDETVWLNASQMTKLFDRDVKTIRKHINNALKEELEDKVVVANFASTTQHGAIYQTFDGKDLYPSIQEKAANLLYLVTKNHTFIDGNKRIAATLFIFFLDYYDILYKDDYQIIDNNTLVAITLLIAESNPREKDILVDVIMNFLNK